MSNLMAAIALEGAYQRWRQIVREKHAGARLNWTRKRFYIEGSAIVSKLSLPSRELRRS